MAKVEERPAGCEEATAAQGEAGVSNTKGVSGDGDPICSELVEGDSSDNESMDVLAPPGATALIPVEEIREFIVATEGAQHRPRLAPLRWLNLHGLPSSLSLILKWRGRIKEEGAGSDGK